MIKPLRYAALHVSKFQRLCFFSVSLKVQYNKALSLLFATSCVALCFQPSYRYELGIEICTGFSKGN